MVTRRFTVVLEPAEEGGFVVKCLELPVATQGETREEALKNIKEAMEGYLKVEAKLPHGKIRGEKVECCRGSLCSLGVKLLSPHKSGHKRANEVSSVSGHAGSF